MENIDNKSLTDNLLQNEDEYRFPKKNQILPKDPDFLTFSHR